MKIITIPIIFKNDKASKKIINVHLTSLSLISRENKPKWFILHMIKYYFQNWILQISYLILNNKHNKYNNCSLIYKLLEFFLF